MARKRQLIQSYRVNERIKANEVRLVLEDGQQAAIVKREDALQMAEQNGLDLVEVAPDADPPVCKLLDYGKFKYQQKKRLRQKHHRSQIKEIWIGPETQEHDLAFKAKHVRQFLQERHKVRVTMRLSGRHRVHGDLALEHMLAFGQRFEDLAKVEQPPKRESSSRVSMVLCPR